MENTIAKKLEISRQELLDIGLRGNTLLHFKPRKSSITIIDEISKQVFDCLVNKQRPMSFLPLPKKLQKKEDEDLETDLLPELLEKELSENRHTDNKLQTKLAQDLLDKKILNINTEAETYFQEQGIDILYLALGFVSWYDSDSSDLERKAPLVLIPVSLNRNSAQERFKLTYTQVDLGTNLTLKAKLKSNFNIELPEFNEEVLIEDYFKSVNQIIKKLDRWKIIENEIHLGFFKFGKFQMYQDLDGNVWPENKKPQNHPIINALLGDGFFDKDIPNDDNTKESFRAYNLQNLENFHFIADADSSQTEAVIEIKKGKNLVIQGPPGTGKSQTITNIIAESLSDDKKILFVSEKMVALEVVKRRLDNCHIGDSVLELHSHKSNKKAVITELKRTLELGKPRVDDNKKDIARYKYLQKKLDDYTEDVKKPILNSSYNFVDAVGLYSNYKTKISNTDYEVIGIKSLYNLSKEDVIKATYAINELITFIKANGTASKNAFHKSKKINISPSDKEVFFNEIRELSDSLKTLLEEVKSIKSKIPFSFDLTIQDVVKIKNLLKAFKNCPDIEAVDLESKTYLKNLNLIKDTIDNGVLKDKIYSTQKGNCIDLAFEFDLLKIRQVYLSKGEKWWRFISSDFNKAKNNFKSLLKIKTLNVNDSIKIIEDLIEFQSLTKKIESNDTLMSNIFGDVWLGANSNWEELSIINNWYSNLCNLSSDNLIHSETLNHIKQIAFCDVSKENIETELAGISKKLNKLTVDLNFEEVVDFDIENLESLFEEYKNMCDNIDDIYTITRCNHINKSLVELNLKPIVDIAFNWSYIPDQILDLFNYSYFKSLLDYAYMKCESIQFFDNTSHLKNIEEFRYLDTQLANFSQENITIKHFDSIPSIRSAGEMAIINREINKKKRHIPIRQLLNKAGNAIQHIKPVFMMSPMSVATFLTQGGLDFDLVIFDEASQVKVVDALIPILRGKQIVVVGDSKQMPPTDFFSKSYVNDDDNEEDNVTGDMESILGMFLAQGVNEKMLRWHYRSRHDSLINVSNKEFYEGKLMVFPSSGLDENACGLIFNHIPDSSYDRGNSRTNLIEAKAVAKRVFDHAKSKKELSLGVVAFSTAQRDCIILEIERLRRIDNTAEDFFSKNNLEDFFVKNLENVQGDERDVIYISIGYGKTASNKMSSSFGPLNREGGERRLNVLISRARLAMEVFCNFTADELNTKADSPFGLKALKNFLKYAETGAYIEAKETGKPTDSPFEDEVIHEIEKLGFQVEPQVGSSGFFIDIAVIDPTKPGRYILAVECDGASYHSSASARDRDRLRQSVLEGLGWRFHRIWSTDWFRSKNKEVGKLKLAIENALDSINYPVKVKESTSNKTKIIRESESASLETVKNNDYKIIPFIKNYNRDIFSLDKIELASYMKEILLYEGVIHMKDVSKRLADFTGFKKVGSNMTSHFNKTALEGHREGLFYFDNDFLFLDKNKEINVRNRKDLENKFKNIDLICDKEVQLAILQVIEFSFSISEKETISEALALLGFNRATAKTSDKIISNIEYLIFQEKIIIDKEKLILRG